MYSCAFFGHRDYPYEKFKTQIKDSLMDLIENHHVNQFYCGARGNFDWVCAKVLFELKAKYPFIKCVRVWAYIPQKNEEEDYFDESVYLLERNVSPLYAIAETNKLLVDRVEYILSGVMHTWGGAWSAVERGIKKGKTVIHIEKNIPPNMWRRDFWLHLRGS